MIFLFVLGLFDANRFSKSFGTPFYIFFITFVCSCSVGRKKPLICYFFEDFSSRGLDHDGCTLYVLAQKTAKFEGQGRIESLNWLQIDFRRLPKFLARWVSSACVWLDALHMNGLFDAVDGPLHLRKWIVQRCWASNVSVHSLTTFFSVVSPWIQHEECCGRWQASQCVAGPSYQICLWHTGTFVICLHFPPCTLQIHFFFIWAESFHKTKLQVFFLLKDQLPTSTLVNNILSKIGRSNEVEPFFFLLKIKRGAALPTNFIRVWSRLLFISADPVVGRTHGGGVLRQGIWYGFWCKAPEHFFVLFKKHLLGSAQGCMGSCAEWGMW